MSSKIRSNKSLDTIIFHIYILLIFSIPLIVTTNLGNPFYTAKNSILTIFGSILIILLVLNWLFYRQNSSMFYFDKKLDLYAAFFFLSFILSAIFSVNPYFSYNGHYARSFALEQIIYVFLIYFISIVFLRDREKRERVFLFMEICAVIVSVYAILQFFGWDFLNLQPQGDKRPVSSLGNGVFVGGFLLLCFPFSFSNAIERKKMDFSLISTILMIIAIILSQTRTAYIGFLFDISLIVLLFSFTKSHKIMNRSKMLSRLKYSFIVLGIILMLLILLIVFAKNNIFVNRFISINEIFKNPRWLLWRDSFKIFLMHPLTGSGVGTFPLAFENIYSLEFKLFDVNSNYDNAHNNFINVLCTMGVIGIVAYLSLIIRSLFLIWKSMFSGVLNQAQKFKYIPFLAMICGYVIYSMTEFDDLSIMLYLFVYLSILKSIYSEDNNLKLFYFPRKLTLPYKFAILVLSLIILSFLSYNVYRTINKIQADRYFSLANSYLMDSDYKSSFDNYTNAIRLWNDNSYYHYQYGGVLLNYASSLLNVCHALKQEYLENARSEFEIAKENYPLKNDCMAFISISDYELGDSIEAEKIKNELLNRDSLFVTFRSQLAAFYIKKQNFNAAMEQLLFICKYDRNSKALNNNISDLINNKNFPNPQGFCEKILAIDPNNVIANKYFHSH